ncbi:MAG: pantoate--beta-alanine ligase, partial [Solirubrobacteraceae bacterium]
TVSLARGGARSTARLLAACEAELEAWSVEPEYVAIVDPQSFEDLEMLDGGGLLLLAARFGKTRLIDNAVLSVGARAQPTPVEPAPTRNRRNGERRVNEREAIACSA